jgi:ATP/ADP translocase
MYRFFKIFFFLFSACFFAQDGIKFENETFQNILNKAKKRINWFLWTLMLLGATM